MTFSEQLNEYIEFAQCSGKELAEASGLSPTVISRYRQGNRMPAPGSEYIAALAKGLSELSAQKGGDIKYEDILAKLSELAGASDFDSELLADNLNLLISTLNINISKLARATNYDASYISRIRNGSRRPADPGAFADAVCHFISANCNSAEAKLAVADLIGSEVSVLDDQQCYFSNLRQWFCAEKTEKPDSISHFLNKLDAFDLNDYIESIHFNDLKVPTVPFQFATSKTYVGLDQMKEGELDFFKATVLSHSSEAIFMCSDMDMADMADDIEFGKKWMFAIAVSLKKGLHLDVIHSIDRPFDEMMLGLESWMPIYMTGQVSPYYLKDVNNSVYQHLNYVSGAAALAGECIVGHHKDGKYYLTKKSEEIEYYRQKTEYMLDKALPLMEIYRSERKSQFEKLISSDAKAEGKRRGILSVPPIYTISDGLLQDILSHNNVDEEDCKRIVNYAHSVRKNIESILQSNEVFDDIPNIAEESFDSNNICLSLEGMFYGKEIKYSYDEYCRHLKDTEEFAEQHVNYHASFIHTRIFKNIQIYVHSGEFVIVSKSNAPAIHFVIKHPKLRDAIENMIMPIQ